MDQRIVAGLGNIYVCEALFRAGLDPCQAGRRGWRRGPASRRRQRDRLVAAIKAVLSDADPRRRLDLARLQAGRRLASAASRTSLPSTAAKASLARGRAAGAGCGARRRAAARPSTARPASADLHTSERWSRAHGVRNHHRRNQGPRRHRPAQPPQRAQRAQRPADRGAGRRRSTRFEADDGIGCIVITGSEKAFAAGADIKEMQSKTYMQAYKEDFISRWDRVGALPQAGGRGGGGLRAGRRLRARHDVRHHHRRRHRQVRPARDQARRHAGLGRHAAADPPGRQGQGHGDVPDGAHDGCGRGRARQPGRPRGAGGVADGGGHEDGRRHRLHVAARSP